MKRILTLLMIAAVGLSIFAGCGAEGGRVVYETADPTDVVNHESYECVYDMIGKNITIDMVKEDANGVATVVYEGTTYTLGMDFLSMAMVYNCTPAGEFTTREQVYNQWWKLYIQRWNYLVPEVPLYANRYYTLYHAKLQNFKTTPYWNAADAIVGTKVKDGEENSVRLSVTADLTGAFRDSDWGKAAVSDADRQIEKLTTGYTTLMYDQNGDYVWNDMALAQTPEAVKNEDGTLTYTMKLRTDMVFSDGTPITAKHYVAPLLANSTVVGMAAGGSGNAGMQLAGYHSFQAYDGTNDGQTVERKNTNGEVISSTVASKFFRGVKLLDDYTFCVTFSAEYADYYYAKVYAVYSPSPLAMYLGGADVETAADGSCCLTKNFYQKITTAGVKSYAVAQIIEANLLWNSGMPYSGPYTVTHYDPTAGVVTLSRNEYYLGDSVRGKASIDTVAVVKTDVSAKIQSLIAGQIDVAEGITSSDDIESVTALTIANPSRYAQTYYDRAGYSKLAFRCDLGPASFAQVRRAVMYTLDREQLLQDVAGGSGTLVYGPYYQGTTAYRVNAQKLIINTYDYSVENAVAELESGGWIYNEKGQTFRPGKDAVRYKKLSGCELSAQNILYTTTDGAYKTLKINGEYYMPLALNWYGTQPNKSTDALVQQWQTAAQATTQLGMHITYIPCQLSEGVYGAYRQRPDYGWDGTAECTCVNYASNIGVSTGTMIAVYDQSFYWTINPDLFDLYSANYLLDEADFWENYP